MVWLVIWAIIVVLGGVGWLYDLTVTGPRRRQARAARKQELFGSRQNKQ